VIYPGGRNDPEILQLEESTTPEWFMQEIGADFSSFTGRIYGEFDEEEHVKTHHFNPAWPNYIAFDWGFTNPLAAVEFQIDPWDNVYVWRTHYKAMTTLPDHLDIMRNRAQPAGYRIDMCFGDAADPEAIATVNKDFAPCIGDPLAKSNWRQGVDRVKMFLKLQQVGLLDEYGTPMVRPKLFLDPSCREGIFEFNNYRAKEGTEAKNAQEVAQGVNDHFLDALRYGLVHIYDLGCLSHLSDVYDSTMLVGIGASNGLAGDSGYFTSGKDF
jgi:hypothetical protein